MSWGNQRNNYRNNNGYNNGNNGNNYNDNNRYNNNRNSNGEKKSRCKHKTYQTKAGYSDECITAANWASQQIGLVKIFVGPWKEGSDEIIKGAGNNEYRKMMCRIDYVNGNQKIVGVLMNIATKKVVIREIGWVLNPDKNYCGPFFKRK